MAPLFAQLETGLMAVTSVTGIAFGLFSWWVFTALTTEDLEQDLEWRYDVSRINELRRADPVFRIFQPVIQLLARLSRAAFRDQLPEIYREIQAAGLTRFWLPEEYLARCLLIALLLAPLYFYLCITYMGAAGAVSAMGWPVLAGVAMDRFRLKMNAVHSSSGPGFR